MAATTIGEPFYDVGWAAAALAELDRLALARISGLAHNQKIPALAMAPAHRTADSLLRIARRTAGMAGGALMPLELHSSSMSIAASCPTEPHEGTS